MATTHKAFLRNFDKLKFPSTFNTCRILIIGKLGTGKSVTGNTLLGKGFFTESKRNFVNSETQVCQQGICQRSKNFSLDVIDTPGMMDPRVCDEWAEVKIAKCFLHLDYQPNVILFVIKASRSRVEIDEKTMEKVQELFGPDCFKYMVVVFTCEDELDGRPLNDCIMEMKHSGSKALSELLKKVGSNYFTLTNTANTSTKEERILKLLEMAQKIMITNDPPYYSHTMSTYILNKGTEYATTGNTFRTNESEFFKRVDPK